MGKKWDLCTEGELLKEGEHLFLFHCQQGPDGEGGKLLRKESR